MTGWKQGCFQGGARRKTLPQGPGGQGWPSGHDRGGVRWWVQHTLSRSSWTCRLLTVTSSDYRRYKPPRVRRNQSQQRWGEMAVGSTSGMREGSQDSWTCLWSLQEREASREDRATAAAGSGARAQLQQARTGAQSISKEWSRSVI